MTTETQGVAAEAPLFVEAAQDAETTQIMAEALAERGIPVPTMNAATMVETVEQQAMAGAGKPAEYSFLNLPTPDFNVVNPQEYYVVETGLRNAMHSAGLPVGIGNEIARLAFGALNKANGGEISDHQRAMEYQSANAQLRAMYGNDFERNIAAADALVAHMDKAFPLSETLMATGLSNNPWIIASLVNVAKARGLLG